MPRYTAPPPNAVRAFKCDLCSKSYSRQNDYDTHLSSYDHSHRARMIELKRITADNAKARPTKRAKRDDMSAPALPVETGAKKKSGGGFTRIQDLANKQPVVEVQPEEDTNTKQDSREEGTTTQRQGAFFSLPTAPNLKKEFSKLVSNRCETDPDREGSKRVATDEKPDIRLEERTDEAKAVIDSTIDISSEIAELDTNFEKKRLNNVGVLDEAELGWGNDKDFGPNYYDPRKPSECSDFCQCGREAGSQPRLAGMAA